MYVLNQDPRGTVLLNYIYFIESNYIDMADVDR